MVRAISRTGLLARLGLTILAALSPFQVLAAAHPPPQAERFSPREDTFLRAQADRQGIDRQIDPRVTEALGLSTPLTSPLLIKGLGVGDQIHGAAYYFFPLADGRLLIGHQSWTGLLQYWLVVTPEFAVVGAVGAARESVRPLGPDMAGLELRRIIAFFRSTVPIWTSSEPHPRH